MTLLFCDGFQDGLCNGTSGKWSSSGFYSTPRSTNNPRFSGAVSAYSVQAYRDITPSSEVFAACAYYWNGSLPIYVLRFAGDAGATIHTCVIVNAAGFLELRLGSNTGTLLATGTTRMKLNVWTQMQFHGTIADSGGVFELRLNGSTTAELSFTGDTKNGGTLSTISQVQFWNNGDGYITDVVINNSAGSVNNTWPGDVRVQTLLPNGNGNTSQGVGSDADSVNNYALVNETPAAAASYVGVTTDTQGDTYAYGDLNASTASVAGVQVTSFALKSDASTKTFKRRARSGGTTYVGSSAALTTTAQAITEILESDPATSAAWTISNLNAAEFGFEAATT